MSTTTARFVTTIDEFMELINAAVEGLLPQAYAAHANGTLTSPREFVRERAAFIAGVINIEADDILGMLVSLGHDADISNEDAQQVVEVALARALTQRMSLERLTDSVTSWRAGALEVMEGGKEARTVEAAEAMAAGALDIVADLYDFALRCGVKREGRYANVLRLTYSTAVERTSVPDDTDREANCLHFCMTVAQFVQIITAAGGPERFMAAVVASELGDAAAA